MSSIARAGRLTFLFRLSDILRSLTDVNEILEKAGYLLGEYLGVSEVCYAEVRKEADKKHFYIKAVYQEGSLPLSGEDVQTGEHKHTLFEALNRPHTIATTDIAEDPGFSEKEKQAYAAIHVHALIATPIFKDGELSGVFCAHQNQPRQWTKEEIALTEEAAERILAAFDRSIAEQKLLENEERLQAIFSGTYEYIGLLSPTGILLDANRAALEFGPCKAEDVIGRPFWETIWFAYTPGVSRKLKVAIAKAATGKFIRWEAFLIRPSGEEMIFDFSLHPVKDETGNVILIVPEARNITGRKQMENKLRSSEAKYRHLYESMDEGFCIIEVLFDEKNKAYDYLILEVNDAFEKQTSLKDVIGKKASELIPGINKSWFEIYGRVATTRNPERFENVAEGKNYYQIFDVYAFPTGEPGQGHVAVLFTNITQRKEREREKSFLLRLSDALRSLDDPVKIQAIAARTLGKELGVSRVVYFEVINDSYYVNENYVDGVPSIVGFHAVTTFGNKLLVNYRKGRIISVNDVNKDSGLSPEEKAGYADIQVRAYIGIPLIRNGSFVAGLAIHQASPRNWTEREITLVQETAERTWAAVARAHIELQLRESEEKYRTLFDSMEEGFCTLEKTVTGIPDFRFMESNSAFELQSGIKNVTGKTLNDALPGLAERWITIFNSVLITGKPFRFEQPFGKEGKVLELNVFKVKRNWSNYIGVIVKDISLHKQEETASHWLASVVESTDDAIVSKTLDGVITSWNPSAERMFGYTTKEAVGQHITLIIPPERHQEEEDILIKLRRGEKVDHFETIRQHKNGNKLNVSLTISPIKDNTGRIIGASKMARDITSRKASERALREWEERFRITLDATRMGTWDWDLTSDELIWNKQQYLLLGLDPEKEKDKPKNLAYFLQFIYPKDLEKVEKNLRSAAEGVNEIYEDQFRIVRADNGKKRWMGRYGRKIKDENGQFTHVLGVMYDITDRKMMERQKDEFIGIASHELRTPVTSIKMYVELILQTLGDKADKQSFAMMQKLDRQVDRLVELINDLLDTTKIAEGKLQLNMKKFSLNLLIKECIETFMPSKKHQILFHADDLESITADRERIGQVITNFISNAVKYSPDGGKVIVRSEKEGQRVRVSVQDEGIGISGEMKSKIFHRFSRVNNPQTFPGIGLGLYVSAEIIKRHGGTISVESQEGKGSVFYFTLPYNV